MKRRDFLKHSLTAAAAVALPNSRVLGAETPPEEIAEAIQANKNFTEAYDRLKTHLAANAINLKNTPPTLGQHLEFDPQKEKFIGQSAKKANKLTKPKYRRPYTIPQKV